MAKKSTKQTARTVVQAGIGLAVALPGLIDATGVDQTIPWVAGGLAVSAAVTRLMAVPQVQKFLGWLNTDDEEK
ncbi:hypothetical protein SEA_YARA_26 [Streptomyces phage Yara]|nr:hypothetical protein SEA_YARA_26 [Streptomyces phage Yara]